MITKLSSLSLLLVEFDDDLNSITVSFDPKLVCCGCCCCFDCFEIFHKHLALFFGCCWPPLLLFNVDAGVIGGNCSATSFEFNEFGDNVRGGDVEFERILSKKLIRSNRVVVGEQ
ncbi:hypothetical protein DERP_011103 [Dermatophagoides pteronyssinus]|uniref:Uncharacterized protein n=1 Tax=Dermatophagoides pteronyssinus TaxID=6956 RepID=A0ABQ8J8W3_DERPT|nr:hypothetical protein DERP_011103 [Dermatophagoides pteronyssinus]